MAVGREKMRDSLLFLGAGSVKGHLVEFKDGSQEQMYGTGTQILATCSQAPHKCTGKAIGVIVPIYSRQWGQEVQGQLIPPDVSDLKVRCLIESVGH